MNIRLGQSYFILLSMLIMSGLSGCSKTPSEEIIVANIDAMEQAIENKDTNDALSLIHENFSNPKGYDKQWVKRTLLLHSLRHHNIELVISKIQVEVKDEFTIMANFHALATGGKGLLPDQGAIYNMDTEWRKQEDEWLIVFAKWKKNLTP